MKMTVCASCGEEIQGPFLIYQGETYCKECVVTCQDCGKQVPEEEAWEYEEEYYCDDCCGECWGCGEYIPKSKLTEVDRELICDSCIKDNCSECVDCGEIHLNSNMGETVNGERTCFLCAEAYYVNCYRCGCYVYCNEAIRDEDGDYYCESCGETFLSICVNCGEYVTEVTPVGDNFYCRNCLSDHTTIKLWNYKVPPRKMIFCRHRGEPEDNKLFFGMEIEIDRRDKFPREGIEELTTVLDEPYAIYKGDGSLNRGVECVTTPMTFDYIHEDFKPRLRDFCKTALDLGYRSHDTNTCGLHIHVSEEALGKYSRCRANDIVRTVNCDHNWKFIALFSRRKGNFEYCERINSVQWGGSSNRYVTVNRQNMSGNGKGTLEFRFFKGTLKWQSILAAVDLCNLIVGLVNVHDDWVAWEQIVETARERNYEYFLNYLKEQKILEKLGSKELKDEQFTLAQAA